MQDPDFEVVLRAWEAFSRVDLDGMVNACVGTFARLQMHHWAGQGARDPVDGLDP